MTDFKVWVVMGIELAPPCELRAKGCASEIGLVVTPPIALTRRAAEVGLHHVPLPYIRRLYKAEVRGTKLHEHLPQITFEM